ncbi:MAG: hypothetical protein NTZ87_04130 [Candidatus Nomurabacteria bacterium]|nr:hypothetical protein [Candidatus Nomurabacteria bacterium]
MEKESNENGALVGLVVIIIILVVGGIYIWLSSQNARKEMQNKQAQMEAAANQDAAALNKLESDSNATDTKTGVDINAIN